MEVEIGESPTAEEVPDKQNGEATEARGGNVTYGIDDAPAWYLCIFMALQHYLTMIGAIVAIPFILCPALCMLETDPDRSNIISTMIFVTGLITWLQCTFGCRLPIVQGGTISFLVPTLAILGLPACGGSVRKLRAMGSQWTDEKAILRDLSLAQGQWVPGGIDAVAAGEKPPSLVVAEETEEDYYRHWTTDGDFTTGPDLSLIKKMLEVVHDEHENEDSCPAPAAQLEITKFKPIPVPMLRKRHSKKANKMTEIPIKARHSRNVAITSILEEIDAKAGKQESVKKVNHWLNMQNMSSMFKKKSHSKASDETRIVSEVVQSNQRKERLSSPCVDQYKPSSWAGEYYQMCVKRSQMQQLVKDSIWDRAKKMMKDIDDLKAEEIRKQQEVDAVLTAVLEATEAQLISKEIRENDNDNCDEQEHFEKQLTVMEKVELPQHRHRLPGACIVCKVLKKQPLENNTADGIQFKEEDEHITHESEPSSPEVFHAIRSEHSILDKTYSIGNYSDDDDAYMYSLVRATFVENLANTGLYPQQN